MARLHSSGKNIDPRVPYQAEKGGARVIRQRTIKDPVQTPVRITIEQSREAAREAKAKRIDQVEPDEVVDFALFDGAILEVDE